MRTPLKVTALTATAVLASVGLGACGGDSDPGPTASPSKISVVAAFYPLQFVAQRVGGDAVTVTNLAKPGVEPHDMELVPEQVRQIVDANLVVYLRGFQPAVDEAVEQNAKDSSFDGLAIESLRDAPAGGEHEGEEHEGEEESKALNGKDPHIWLDPTRLATLGDKLADRLATLEPGRAADFRNGAAALRAELGKLDTEYTDSLGTCQRREIVTSHAAFGYLAGRYQLEQIPISGLSPEEEPSPQHMAEVAEQARARKVTTIFFETLVSPKVAETIAREVGAKAEVLDPIEGLTPGSSDDYLSVMRTNLGRLKAALGCG
ncbi:zinc transport system substrate-binding protein [Micromonospora pisi]|uniref:Zinc transport system substrate-binding protein n=1 Tax=Micromonospora pisi TaxID=589240 RepID=A0A495JH24_9ACTN|nr:metal ABC transporter substrate-binding protein [Micromonospora pisi]RKR88340.1 zinc transport system substrate-binding protein [Micromonospora pisi]